MRRIELLAPAKDKDTAKEAILHGADAVYIGPQRFGARSAASNSIDDIKEVVDFAHPYRVKVYATVNTLIYENELRQCERLIASLYRIGVDAIIVQDLGILRLDIPPIALHASTQCDADTVEKARWLEDLGFSQLVLPRELTLEEIRRYHEALQIPLESFVHGALCVSYSGRCSISQHCLGRSANRGECAQFCRMPYTLRDASGNVLAKDRYLLSLRDFNASDRLRELLQAGVSSFKIEGRLKDIPYVKNVTAYYRRALDAIFAHSDGEYSRSSAGESVIGFEPSLEKSFNRGFTHYFLDGARPAGIARLDTNKSLGEPLKGFDKVNNGDGISYFDAQGVYTGMRVNDATRLPATLKGRQLYRTFDVAWEKQLARQTASRKIAVNISVDEHGCTATDERGITARVALDAPKMKAEKPMDPEKTLTKLGNTIYVCRDFRNLLKEDTFIPASSLAEIRRRLVGMLDLNATTDYRYDYRLPEKRGAGFYKDSLQFSDNVANTLSRSLYADHGVKDCEMALEVKPRKGKETVVMTCRHCILRELGRCLRHDSPAKRPSLPLELSTGPHRFQLQFDCDKCQMKVLSR